ncbi:hypothetical protein [Escherichia albertii]|uniref:hypothetical protein n=1 Tax=Escherichia albertii TaxID=208962 RepID=UPI0019D1DA66|nr:hypothetical protein [Escherichia albertii]
MELRQQVMEGQIGGFLLGGERVRVSYMPDTGRFLAEGEGQGRVYAELLNNWFCSGKNRRGKCTAGTTRHASIQIVHDSPVQL